ncbi:hypothetical protein A2276_07125 [candidate division WOR-1 bacterium RIFOXYA12_FULL_43_27]|uniref:HAD family hydrolase n=1 Tax=candidate division WOR-1 bacterium RIFOXYC2_FULL_46_14 TaxID=1802587 RepID=A0A1F4U3G3_UNCSA|nr:MAG: hypothetical protein A2276_07125 [candidate division WOR-1 bacterium RIFOXYA12_FULL_43_27]OGC18857.1 MAG: hypothetical protein A2292_07980 [candidate division WOR-1 bacterium RIFOXYB2_FULL_46_45]OGC28998.1 MAG: hypothetical protein A2232_03045 [candidate division WOR-1 bacterium RIFOXYA2_FULL_46_56]OGC39380.1 MAG: hypothetical protein A2438_06660 [candidate division WOR-1 bacterium RIFOXYC2_FULL_46_14]
MNSAAFFDVDNTILNGYTQVILAKHLLRKGVFPFRKYVNVLIWYLFYKAGLINNFSDIRDKSIEILKGWPKEKLSETMRECFDCSIKKHIYKKMLDLIAQHKKDFFKIILVSSSLDFLVDEIKKYLSADITICSELEIVGGVSSGKVLDSGISGEKKAEAITLLAKKLGINLNTSYAYSDHISDLPFLEKVGIPVAINPDKQLRKICEKKGWEIYFLKEEIGC